MDTIKTEVLVIGSGFGAAAPALRLAERGLEVLMVEKGPDIVPERDFKQSNDPKYLLQYLHSLHSANVGFTYAEALGGGSGFYEMVSLRAPSKAFEQREAGTGYRYWPREIDRRAMDPFYDTAERMLKVEQIAEEDIPKSGVVFSYMMKRLGYSCERARYAVQGCYGSGFCVSGCIYGAKQSLHLNYLPQARDLGMKVMTDTEAVDIRTLPHEQSDDALPVAEMPYRYGVRCRNRKTGEWTDVLAKLVVMGGGTVGTAALLLRSKENLPFLSLHLGKNIAFNGSVKTVGILPEGFLEGDMLTGRSHPGVISYEFLESRGIAITTAKPLPLQVVTAARLVLDGDAQDTGDWGEAGDALMKLYRKRMMVLVSFGLTPPVARLWLKHDFDPQPELELTKDLSDYYRDTEELLNSILTRNGCRLVHTNMIDGEGSDYKSYHYGTAHMVGSARMADSWEHGVTDANGEVFNYPGLFVTDGASVPTSLAVNTSLTILANAERIANGMAERFGRERIISILPIAKQ